MVNLTMGCVWLGLLANSARRQQAAVAELARLGAVARYDRQVEDLWAPAWLRNFVGDDYFRNVVGVQLHGRTDNRRMRPLASAELEAAVATMQRLPRLNNIYFAHTGITDDDLARLAPLANQIEELYFNEGWHPNLNGAGLKHLAPWPRLRSLAMPCGRNNPAALGHLAAFPALTDLTWRGTEMDDDDFAALARCKKLERLRLFLCGFNGAAFSQLRNAPALKNVHLRNTRPAHFARHSPGQTNLSPIYDDPRNEFEYVPDGRLQLPRHGPAFPEQHYREWLKELLPGVTVSEM
jgi:hypothetical protein